MVLGAGSTVGPLSNGEGAAWKPWQMRGGALGPCKQAVGGGGALSRPPPPSLPLTAPQKEQQLFQSFLPFLETGVG